MRLRTTGSETCFLKKCFSLINFLNKILILIVYIAVISIISIDYFIFYLKTKSFNVLKDEILHFNLTHIQKKSDVL